MTTTTSTTTPTTISQKGKCLVKNKNNFAPINIPALLRICQVRDFSRIAPEYGATLIGDRTYFIDRGKKAKTLSVVHFDTVWNGKGPAPVRLLQDKTGKAIGINTIQLDDRLGAYILLEMLPALGIESDVLITTDEEIGKSTARNFSTSKNYNWIYSFDRRGLEPVTYQYGDVNKWEDAILTWTKIAWGSFSDICDLDELGVCGVNWATAYYLEHTASCRAYFSDVYKVVNDFMYFYRENKDTRFPYDYTARPRYTGAYSSVWTSDKGWTKGTYSNNYANLQARIDNEYENDALSRLGWDDETYGRDDWAPKYHKNSDHHHSADQSPDGTALLCEYCWGYSKNVNWSPNWGGYLCDTCLIDLSNHGLDGGG